MRIYLTKMQQMMNIVKIAGTREGIWIDQRHYQWDVKQYSNLFQAIDVKYFKYPTKQHIRQLKQITCKTVLESYFNIIRYLHVICMLGPGKLAAKMASGEGGWSLHLTKKYNRFLNI